MTIENTIMRFMHMQNIIKKTISYFYQLLKFTFNKVKVFSKKHHLLYVILCLIRFYVKGINKQKKIAKKWNVLPLSSLVISDHKRSDTIFILASGSSINNISSEQWKFIKKHDSLGFNKWLYHDHVPTYYCLETSDKQERVNILYQLLYGRKNDYAEVPIIYRGAGSAKRIFDIKKTPHSLRDNFYVSCELDIPGDNIKELDLSLSYLNKLGYFNKNNIINFVFHKRASVVYNIMFAFLAGYRNIILCGVDLNNIDYFYQTNPSHYLDKGLPFLDPGQTQNIHRTIDPNAFPNVPTADAVIYSVNDALLKPKGINLYVAFSTSALYPKLPTYFEQT